MPGFFFPDKVHFLKRFLLLLEQADQYNMTKGSKGYEKRAGYDNMRWSNGLIQAVFDIGIPI